MTARTATLISRIVIGLGLLMIAVAILVSRTTTWRADPHEIVVIPQGLTSRVVDAAATLRNDPEAATDPSLADAPEVMQHEQDRVAQGVKLTTTANSPGAGIVLVVSLLWMGTGSVIVSRQPRNLAGWVFLALGFLIVLEGLSQIMVFAALKADAGIPLVSAWAIAGEYAVFPMVLLPLLWLLFPDGRPPSPRWRWAVRGFVVAVGVALAAYVVTPGPLNNFVDFGVLYMNPLAVSALSGIAPAITGIGGMIALILAIATIFGVRGRFKRATGDERQQLRWLVFVTTLAGVLFFVIFGSGLIAEQVFHHPNPHVGGVDVFDLLFGLLAGLIVLGIPGAYLIAIYRYHLWDLDVVIKKALVFAVVAGGLTVVSLGVLLLLPVLVVGTGLTSTERGVFVVGVVIGTLFGPLRRLARRAADRAVYHTRATPYEVLTEFSGRVGETYATDDVLPRMAQILATGAGASSARVLLSVGGDLREAAAFGGPVNGTEHLVAVTHQGRELGALAVQLKLLEQTAGKDPDRDRRLAATLGSQASAALEDLRDLARGIYPPLLADKGLSAAIEAQARKAAIPVEVGSNVAARYPRDVESAVYFCVLEALNNVAKYAQATSATVTLAQADGHLTFEVSDDGAGFDPDDARNGTGLQGMADRLDAIGGSLTIRSVPGLGSTVGGTVPIS